MKHYVALIGAGTPDTPMRWMKFVTRIRNSGKEWSMEDGKPARAFPLPVAKDLASDLNYHNPHMGYFVVITAENHVEFMNPEGGEKVEGFFDNFIYCTKLEADS